jgi:inner membrane protein
MNTDPSTSFLRSTSVQITLKLALITLLVLFLMIPQFMILDLITERENLSHQVTDEVAAGWGNSQISTGPVLVIPYNEWFESAGEDKKKYTVKKNLFVFPEELKTSGNLDTQEKYKSIYKVLLYQTQLDVQGSFIIPNDTLTGINRENLLLNEAVIIHGISDIKGMKSLVDMKVNGLSFVCKPGLDGQSFTLQNIPFAYNQTEMENSTGTQGVINSGIFAQLRNIDLSPGKTLSFSYKLQLNGSRYLYFTPVGKTTDVNLKSTFPDPSFAGAYLPEHTTTRDGFDAKWSVLEYNKNLPEFIKSVEAIPLGASSFGVEIRDMVSHYGVTYRTGKYMILFLVLTFLVVFLTEIVYQLRIHIFQYTLIGLALALFFTLLLSFSEFVGYMPAYIIAASATIILIYLYSLSVFRHKKSSSILLGLLLSLFTYIYLIIQMEKMALLAGTIGLFVFLAATMYVTRKIKWYEDKD